MRYASRLLGIVAFLAGGAFVSADEIEDVVKLSKAGVAEDTIVAYVERSRAEYRLTPEQILALKAEKVSDKVIAAMLRKRVNGTAPAAAPVRPGAGEEAETVSVNVENSDDQPLSLLADAAARILVVYRGFAEGRVPLHPHAATPVKLPKGRYELRWQDRPAGLSFDVSGGKALIVLSRVKTDQYEAVYGAVFDSGERKAGGRLAQISSAPQPAEKPAAPPRDPKLPGTDTGYRSGGENPSGYGSTAERGPAPSTAYVAPRTVYYDSPTVYVGSSYSPYYYSPYYYSYPSYYRSCYSGYSYRYPSYWYHHPHYSSFGGHSRHSGFVGYSHHGRHSSFGVGFRF